MPKEPVAERLQALQRVPHGPARRGAARSRARAAWTAASRSATPAARWATSFPTGTTWCIATTGARRSTGCTPRTTFPEFTGRVCPAPCEAACVLGINEDPVTIKQIEMSIADRGFDEGWIVPEPPLDAHRQARGRRRQRAGGPGRRAAAQPRRPPRHRLRAGRSPRRPVDVRHSRLQAGKVPRLAAHRADGGRRRRVPLQRQRRRQRADAASCATTYDAILLTGGATHARDLPIPGRELKGIHFAMEFLPQQNKRNQGDTIPDDADPGHRQGRDRHRRRRHRQRLHGTSNRQGCTQPHAVRAVARSRPTWATIPRAGERPAEHALALLAGHPAHQHLARRRLRARSSSILTKEFLGDDARPRREPA